MRDVVRYSEAFKLRAVEDVAAGKYASLDEAGRRNGIRGCSTLSRWIKQYGREGMLPKRVRVETMSGIDELKAARSRIRELEAACCLRQPGRTRAWIIVLRARFWT
ncbi:MAG: transposase [Spirochaetaceae bacterium]|jgi:transposase-like protein|nr:transposase [Spirochaetaceae bacterium]